MANNKKTEVKKSFYAELSDRNKERQNERDAAEFNRMVSDRRNRQRIRNLKN